MGGDLAWSESLAEHWDDGIVAGTGVVGAVLYGGPSRHEIAFAHERFFLPANSRRPAPELAPALDEIRAALLAGDSRGAADAVDRRLGEIGWPDDLIWTDPLAPCARLSWVTAAGDDGDYRREVDLGSGDGAVSWADPRGRRSGVRIRTAHGEESVVVELWSEAGMDGELILGPVTERGAGGEGIGVVDYSGAVAVTASASASALRLAQVARGVDPGVVASVVTTLECLSGAVSEPAERGDEATWRVTLAPGAAAAFTVTLAVTDDPVSVEATESLPELFTRSRLDLGTPDHTRSRSTEQLWAAARAGDEQAERDVIALAYAAGRRNIIASTGALPPTLQGVWQGTWSPAWSADYTMNGNVQNGTMASVIWTGTPELTRALFRLVVPFADHYRENARRIFGLDGMLLPARMTTHGHANHFIRSYPHEFWTGHGGWLLRIAADYVATTGDRTPLSEWLWEFTLEVLRFSQHLAEAGGGHLAPGYSPENTPSGGDNPLTTDATMDRAIFADALRVGIWFAELVGDSAQRDAWSTLLDTLPGYRITDDGMLAEWGSPTWPDELAHRHSSHLYPLWYDPDPAFAQAELAAAARATVRAKIAWRAEDPGPPPGRMEMAFGLVQLGLAAAALGDATSAHHCVLWLARDHFTPALVSTHDAGRIFNLDASGGLPAVVAAMLLGSSIGELRILPALPASWPRGSMTGLAARGGLSVDLAWSPDEVSVTLRPVPGADWLRTGSVVLRFPDDVEPRDAGDSVRALDARSIAVDVPPGMAPVVVRVGVARDR